MSKYELVLNDKKEFLGRTLYRVRALDEMADRTRDLHINGIDFQEE